MTKKSHIFQDTGDEEEFDIQPNNFGKIRASTKKNFLFLDEDEEVIHYFIQIFITHMYQLQVEIVGKKIERSESMLRKNKQTLDGADEVFDGFINVVYVHLFEMQVELRRSSEVKAKANEFFAKVNDEENNEEALVPSNSAEARKRSTAIKKIMKFKTNTRNKHMAFACNICEKDISVLEDSLNLVVCTCVKCNDSYYHASCLGRYMLNMPKLVVENYTSYNLYERVCPVCERDQSMSLLIDFAREEDGGK